MCLWGGDLWCYGEGACDIIVRIVRGCGAMGGGCGAMGGGGCGATKGGCGAMGGGLWCYTCMGKDWYPPPTAPASYVPASYCTW